MSSQKLKVALAISVIVNVFLIGGVGGGLVFWRLNPQIHAPATPGPGAGQRRALRFAADGLRPEQQQAFRQALRQARRDVLPQLRAGQDARRTLVGLIGAPDFDRSAVDAALGAARDADIAVRARAEAAVVDYAAGLSAQDRAVFVRGLARSPTLRQPAPQKPQGPATENSAPAR